MLQTFYVQDSEVYNERDIITDSGLLFRPDRLNIINNNAIIIDYKTGSPKSSHASQLDGYSNVLSRMGFKVTHKYLVYINDAIKVIEV
jgi:CRISPR/Cas system-associated exonuclease Cas4 (RecB family)